MCDGYIHTDLLFFMILAFRFLAGNYEEEGEDLGLNLKLLSVLDNPAIIVAAAASGDVGTLRDFLTKHPSQVHCKLHVFRVSNFDNFPSFPLYLYTPAF